MRRALRSWTVLGAGVLLLAVVATVALAQVQSGVADRATRAAIRTGTVVSGLVVTRTVRPVDFQRRALTTSQQERMDADIAWLVAHDGLVGVQIWHTDGHPLYVAPRRPGWRSNLSAGLRARAAAATAPWAVRTGRDAALDVFLPYDPDHDGVRDGLVQVRLPDSSVSGSVAVASHYVEAGTALLLLALGGVLLFGRRRLLRRERAAGRDPLTGLANRAAFSGRVASLCHTRTPGTAGAVLLLDLDDFRSVNDTLGHPAGDAVLAQVAGVLVAGVRPHDLVARLGGDDFAVLVGDLPGGPGQAEEIARELARHLLSRLRGEAMTVHGVEVAVAASVGVALTPRHGNRPDVLMRRAEVAMYQAKRSPTSVEVYDPATDPYDVSRLALLVELRRAIASNQLVLHYQPKADLRTDRLTGVEALVRWVHPTRGLVGPGEFVPLAESTGLIGPLSDWVLREAIAQVAEWSRAGLLLPVAVNLSAHNLLDHDLPAMLLTLLADADVPADLIELEVTETAVMTDPERVSTVLARLHAMGVRTAIDDFGVGHTSLRYLRQLPVHTLKIDRSFVAGLPVSADNEAIVESVITVGHRLGLTVLGEGVETAHEWQRLAALGCDEAQGFLLARPMPAAELSAWVAARSSRVRQTG